MLNPVTSVNSSAIIILSLTIILEILIFIPVSYESCRAGEKAKFDGGFLLLEKSRLKYCTSVYKVQVCAGSIPAHLPPPTGVTTDRSVV